ncbi:MAG: HlyD family efflux transporter periplasmic adaptor subunit, partial [Polyangiaceae bacterium]
ASWSALFALTVAGTLFALRPAPVPVDVAAALRGPLLVAVEESGVTRIKDRYVVSAPVAGELARIWLDPGDELQKGDVIARIAPALPPLLDERTRREARARLSAAVSALGQSRAQVGRATTAKELAERELNRDMMLALKGSIAPQGLDRTAFEARMRADELASATFAARVAEEEVRRARAVLEEADTAQGETETADIPSPVPGNILKVLQRSAGLVAPGTPLFEVGDLARLEIVVDLLTTDAVQVEPGTSAEIIDWGSPRVLHGEVLRIEPSAFTKLSALGVDEQRVNVVITLTDPRERWLALGDGYRVRARIPLWRSPEVTKVPIGALFRHGDGWAVYRVEGRTAKLASVEVGHRGETEAEITSGLGPGELVAVHPGDRVAHGVRVEARND